jgi:hypothetical protein
VELLLEQVLEQVLVLVQEGLFPLHFFLLHLLLLLQRRLMLDRLRHRLLWRHHWPYLVLLAVLVQGYMVLVLLEHLFLLPD